MSGLRIKSMLLIIGCAFVGSAHAGNWLRNEGETSYSANLKYSTSNKYWDQFGNSLPQGCTSESESLYQNIEHGYSYRYTLIGGIGLDNNHCAAKGSSAGFGDLTLGVRGRLDLERNGKAWEVSAIVPTGYNNQLPLRLGNGRFGVRAGVYFGDRGDLLADHYEDYSSDPYKAAPANMATSSWNYGVDVTFWEGPPADQLGAYIRYGDQLSQDWRASAELKGNWSLGHGTPEPILGVPWLRASWHDVVTAKLDFSRNIGDGWSMSISPEMNVWGRNASQATAISIGLHKLWGN
jgi:hypothetical protein